MYDSYSTHFSINKLPENFNVLHFQANIIYSICVERQENCLVEEIIYIDAIISAPNAVMCSE